MSNLKDWADVPTVYKWRAFDRNGCLAYYVQKPIIGDFAYWSPTGGHSWFPGGSGPMRTDWRDTLEQRPE